MKQLIRLLYTHLPKSVIKFIGTQKSFAPLRDMLLRNKGDSKTIVVKAHWKPEGIDFNFKSDIKTSVRAENKGIENTLLKLSLKLLKYKDRPNDNVIIDVGASF